MQPLTEGVRLSRRWVLRLAPILAGLPVSARQSPPRPRVLVSTDIGGTDPDDFQSMVHLLLCSCEFDIEGLISSPYGPGRLEHLLEVIGHYETDYPNLKTWSPHYPTPAALRAISRQGAIDSPGASGASRATDGSRWIVQCARRNDPRPLYVLIWGGLEDLAQALHDAPDILPKLRVYFIGGPNKTWSVDAYNSIEQNHPKLWMIENNATYRGFFVGGNQRGEWGNTGFVAAHIAGHGSLGGYFATHLKGVIKMGDTPSVSYLLKGTPEDPTQPGWGGRFVRIWDGRKSVFTRPTTEKDRVEVFGVTEFILPLPSAAPPGLTASVQFDNRLPSPVFNDGRALRFRFSPRDAKLWTYRLLGDFAGRNELGGKFNAVPPPPERTSRPSLSHPNWWIDDPDPAAAEGVHPGARHVNRWRQEYLADFRERMQRCKAPKP